MKVNNAMVCLDCDEVHDHAICPKCLSGSSVALRRWLKPMNPVIKESNLQEVSAVESKTKTKNRG